jgi:hypothetical protein
MLKQLLRLQGVAAAALVETVLQPAASVSSGLNVTLRSSGFTYGFFSSLLVSLVMPVESSSHHTLAIE